MVNFEGLTCVMQLHATEHLLSMHGWLVGCNRGHAGCPGRVLGLELWQVACVPRWWLHSTGMIHRLLTKAHHRVKAALASIHPMPG